MDSSPRISNLVTELTDPQFLSGLYLWRNSWVRGEPANHGHGEGEGDRLEGDHVGPLWTILVVRPSVLPPAGRSTEWRPGAVSGARQRHTGWTSHLMVADQANVVP